MMESKLINYLVEERLEQVRVALEQERTTLARERAAERATLEQERAALEERLQQALVEAVEQAVAARFPAAPFALVTAIRQVRDPDRLQQLLRAVLQAPDQASAERALHEAAGAS